MRLTSRTKIFIVDNSGHVEQMSLGDLITAFNSPDANSMRIDDDRYDYTTSEDEAKHLKKRRARINEVNNHMQHMNVQQLQIVLDHIRNKPALLEVHD